MSSGTGDSIAEVRETIGHLIEMGFDNEMPAGCMIHPDGRAAVVLPNGDYSVHSTMADAVRWRDAHPEFAELLAESNLDSE